MAHLGAVQEFGASINIKARQATIYNKLLKNGNLGSQGRFVKKKKSNFARSVSIGSHTINIPARPFMREGIDKNMNNINKLSEDLAGRIIDRKVNIRRSLKLIGQEAEKGIKNNMSSGDFTPNAASTLKKKKSSTPLIDTGRLRQSITSVVE